MAKTSVSSNGIGHLVLRHMKTEIRFLLHYKYWFQSSRTLYFDLNMNKFIDAEKLIAEIERQQRRLMVLSSNTKQVDMKRDCALQNGVYSSILIFINSLQQEQPEVDLDKEVEEWIIKGREDFELDGWVAMGVDCIARHFYELGRNARKE